MTNLLNILFPKNSIDKSVANITDSVSDAFSDLDLESSNLLSNLYDITNQTDNLDNVATNSAKKISNSIGLINWKLIGITAAITAIIFVADKLIKTSKEIQEAAQKAKNEVDGISKSFDSLKKSTDEFKYRYAELAQEVSALGKATQSQGNLSTDEYNEFLDISNELAKLYPQLTTAYDENGNAILNLTGDVNGIVGSLDKLVDTQRKLSNIEIMEKMPDIYAGYRDNTKKYGNTLSKQKEELEDYKRAYDAIINRSFTYNQNTNGTYWKVLELLGNYSSDFIRKNQQNIINSSKKGKSIDLDFSILPNTDVVLDNIDRSFAKINAEYQNQIQLTESNLKQEYSELRNYIYTYLSTDDFFYNSLNDNDKNIINGIVGNLDLSQIDAKSWEELEQYIDSNIVQAISNISDNKIKDKMSNLLFGEIDAETNIVSLYNEILNYLIGQEGFDPNNPLVLYYKSQLSDYQENRRKLASHLSKSGLRQEDFYNNYDSLTQEQIDKLLNLRIPDGTIKSWEELLKLITETESKLKNSEFDIPKFSSDTEIFEGLQSLYGSFRENVENGKLKNPLDIGDVQGLDDSLKALDSFKEFQETVLNSNSTVDEVQKAFDKLATEYANTKFQVDEITDANKDLIASQMELDGITKESARDFVEYYSSLNKIKDVKIDSSFIKNNSEELISNYRENENELLKEWTEGRYTDLEKLQSKYGNIDMDNRFLIEYNEKFLEANREAMSTWEVETDEMGKVVSSYYTQIKDEIENGNYTIDTVYGGSDLFGDKNNLEISFSPILQTDDGAKFVAQNELYDYINNIINSAKQRVGENASESDLFNEIIKLDSEEGKKVGSAFGKGLISGITDTVSGLSLDNLDAFDVGSLTHFSGDFGSVGAYEQYIEDFNKALEDSDVASAVFIASIHNDEIALQNLAEYLGVSTEQLALYSLQEQLVNDNNIDTTDDCRALLNLAEQAGATGEVVELLADLLSVLADMETAVQNQNWDLANDLKVRADGINKLIQNAKNNMELEPDAIFDPSKVKKTAGGAGKEAGDAYVDAFEKELEKLKSDHDAGLMSDTEYLARYKELIEKYFKGIDKYAQKYTELMKDYRDQLKGLFDSVISGVTSLLDKKINLLQEQQEEITKGLEKEKEAAVKAIEDQIDAIDDLIESKQDQIDRYQEEIDKINEAAEARQREIKLQQAEYNLQKAMSQRTRLVKCMPGVIVI